MKLLCVLLSLPILGGLAFAGEPSDPPTPGATEIAASGNRFACDLYDRLRTQAGNIFLSPYSISTALAMTREGARGATRAELDGLLHVRGDDVALHMQELERALIPRLVPESPRRDAKPIPAYQLSVAGALWGQEGLSFEAPFLETLRDRYGSPLERIDFRQTAQARARINRWVAEETRDRIQDIVPDGMPSSDTLLALANAIYFQASWAEPFREAATKEADFHAAADSVVQVPMMNRIGRYRYGVADDAQVLELPYRADEMSMVVVLPKARDGLAALEAGLDADRMALWTRALASHQVDVQLPRFTFTTAFDLTATLRAMGLLKATDPHGAADFTGMTREKPLYIGVVLHKAFVAVDEEGTEAAAATVVMMKLGAAAPSAPVPFVADHPFLFFIRHNPTGCILFLGRVQDPTAP